MNGSNPTPGNGEATPIDYLKRLAASGKELQRGTMAVFPDRFNQRLEHPEISLLEFSKVVQDGSGIVPELYIELMRRVLPLDSLRNLPPAEVEWFCMAVSWLNDYSILLYEFAASKSGREVEFLASPILPSSSGPWIDHILVRGNSQPDFSQLETFGVTEGGVL
jgi:hypothetical protein